MFQKQKFDKAATQFLSSLKSNDLKYKYLWQAQTIFQRNWNPDLFDYKAMLDTCLDENSDPSYLPMIKAKSILLKMVEVNEDLVRNMFSDFFNEEKDLLGRMGRFEFHCDLLGKEVQKKYPKEYSHHHHQKILLLYLTLRFPGQYIPFNYHVLQQTMQKLGSLNALHEYEIDRYYKIVRIMHKFLIIKANEIKSFPSHINCHSLLLTYEFIQYC